MGDNGEFFYRDLLARPIVIKEPNGTAAHLEHVKNQEMVAILILVLVLLTIVLALINCICCYMDYRSDKSTLTVLVNLDRRVDRLETDHAKQVKKEADAKKDTEKESDAKKDTNAENVAQTNNDTDAADEEEEYYLYDIPRDLYLRKETDATKDAADAKKATGKESEAKKKADTKKDTKKEEKWHVYDMPDDYYLDLQ